MFLDCRFLPCPQPVMQCREGLETCPKEINVLVDNKPALENVTRFLEKNAYQIRVENKEENLWSIKGVKSILLIEQDNYMEYNSNERSTEVTDKIMGEVEKKADKIIGEVTEKRAGEVMDTASIALEFVPADSLSLVSALLQESGGTLEKEMQDTYKDYALALVHMESDKKTIIFITSDCLGSGDEMLGGKLMESFLSCLKEMHIWQIILLNSGVRLTTKVGKNLENLQELESNGVKVLVCGACLSHYGLYEEKRVGETTNMLDIITALDLADKVIRP